MRADQYEDAVRIVTGSGGHAADEFRDGTHRGKWSAPRSGLAQLITQVRNGMSSLACCDEETLREIEMFGLGRAIRNLTDNEIEDTEAAFLAVANLVSALQLFVNSVNSSD